MQYSTTEFKSIYMQCFQPAMRLAMGMLHDEDEARDVVQEVFVKLWESECRVTNPAGFIIRAVRNMCLNRKSMFDTREKIRCRLTLEPPPDETPDQRGEEVSTAITTLLTLREQEVVEKIYSRGMSYKEAAATLDVSEAAVNKHIVSALKKLRNHFKTNRS